MVLIENWAVPIEAAQAFFRRETDVAETEQGFLYKDCSISLSTAEPKKLGKLSFPCTQLCLEGSTEAVKAIRWRFMLQFLSAGG